MKYIAIAMLFAVVQASLPVPRQTPATSASPRGGIQSTAEAKRTPTSQLSPATNAKQTPSHDEAGNGQATNSEGNPIVVGRLPTLTVAPPKKDWADWGYWFFNLGLVVVGVLQIVLLCWTLRAIRHQAAIMLRQWQAMRGQARLMGEQLAEMQAQTTANMQRERARLRIEIENVLIFTKNILASPVKYRITHYGPSEAYISESFIKVYVSASRTPDNNTMFSRPMLMLPGVITAQIPPIDSTEFSLYAFTDDEIEQVKNGHRFVHFVGFIRYHDVFGNEHWVRFNRVWTWIDLLNITETRAIHHGYWEECGEEADNEQD